MAELRNSKYFTDTSKVEEQEHVTYGPNGGIPAKFYKDGSIAATKFIDSNDSSMSSSEFKASDGVDGFYFEKELDSATKVQYVPANIEKVYKTNISSVYSLANQFAVIRGKVKRFVFENLDRFIHADRFLKKGIKEVRKLKNKFYFTDKKFNTYINKPFIDSSTYGPYNYDTQIKVTKDLEFINDILVVRTGSFHDVTLSNGVGRVPFGENICFVSPHEFLAHTGTSDYISTGVKMNYVYYTGVTGELDYEWTTKTDGITNQIENYSITSKYIKIPKGTTLETSLAYQKAQFDGTSASATYTNTVAPSKTSFNNFLVRNNTEGYSGKHQRGHNVDSQPWNGVIPSGAFIKIETWSTNPDYVGFDGELEIVPVDSEITCTYSVVCTGEGIDKAYDASIIKAQKDSTKKLHRKVNNYLIEKGIKPKNSGKRNFENLITKNAQNIYEGLSYIRNESIQKQRGVEFSPLDSPYYFDGTNQIYGGSKVNSNYSYTDIVKDLNKSVVSSVSSYTVGGTSTSTSSSTSSTSSTGY